MSTLNATSKTREGEHRLPARTRDNVHRRSSSCASSPATTRRGDPRAIDQWLVLVKGEGEVRLTVRLSAVGKGSLIAVPAGTTHNVITPATRR